LETVKFLSAMESLGVSFYTGVPDSLISAFIDLIIKRHGISSKHIIAANEGAAVGLAAGHYLATSKPALVYMQNSGIGNTVNPIGSLLHENVYAIPVVFVIGWRGEPGVKDEPQHVFQGRATLSMLDCLEIPYAVISSETDENTLSEHIDGFKKHLESGRSVAFVIRKDALAGGDKPEYTSTAKLSRENALRMIFSSSDSSDIFVCSTGKLSREVFEIREQEKTGHSRDFLTVGSMGHSLMIAYGIALEKPEKKIFCLDGDGAALMHMGSLAVVGVNNPKNLVHIVINNGAHESVGCMPAVTSVINLCEVASALGYRHSFRVATEDECLSALSKIKNLDGAVFLEIMCNLESRSDLGRPTTSPIQNKNDFMASLRG
jgi:phosphonopyruvate decarboxylase